MYIQREQLEGGCPLNTIAQQGTFDFWNFHKVGKGLQYRVSIFSANMSVIKMLTIKLYPYCSCEVEYVKFKTFLSPGTFL